MVKGFYQKKRNLPGPCPRPGRPSKEIRRFCAESQNRTGDTAIFSRVLYQLSYLGRIAHSYRTDAQIVPVTGTLVKKIARPNNKLQIISFNMLKNIMSKVVKLKSS
jgi:hypothetical protein